uniref:Protein yellow n=1 Tax=Phlebotomus papatasi TaxID=29031 RepID=A0A1B0DFR8_PHLPP
MENSSKPFSGGIPATLTYIDLDKTPSGSPALIPYPDWKSNAPEDCPNGLNTVYRIKADICGRLWVLDTGTLGIGNATRNPCPYALNVFDLGTNRRIRRYVLRPEDTNMNTFIANIAIDIGATCEDTYAYMSDELAIKTVGCWHASLPYTPRYHDVVDRDDEALIFPADVKIDFNNDVWVISDRMPNFLIAELDYKDINFRIFQAPLHRLISGTICDVNKPIHGHIHGHHYAPLDHISSPQLISQPAPTSPPRSSYTPKAYFFNSHNGVSLEMSSPVEYHHFQSTPSGYHGFKAKYSPVGQLWTRKYW